MSLSTRFTAALRRQGIKPTLVKFLGVVADYWFDWRYGTDTITTSRLDSLTISAESREHGTSYEGIRVMPARRIIPHLKGMVPGAGVFVDLGCGKGKALMVAAQFGVAKVRGVEFARELCESAIKNWQSFHVRARCRAEACEIVEGDVTSYNYAADETIYFINNPFDEIILAKVMERISDSVRAHPRRVLVVICNLSAHFRKVMDGQKTFTLVQEPVFWAYPFSIYSNQLD
jgi:SAM-dependent methyltransferase